MFFVKALAVWLLMVVAAIGNGVLRELVLNKYFAEFYALLISGVLLAMFVFAIIYFSIRFFSASKRSYYLLLGVFWTGLTLSFEYGFGYFVRAMTLSEINQVFNVSNGNLFVLVIAVTLFAPLLITSFNKKLE